MVASGSTVTLQLGSRLFQRSMLFPFKRGRCVAWLGSRVEMKREVGRKEGRLGVKRRHHPAFGWQSRRIEPPRLQRVSRTFDARRRFCGRGSSLPARDPCELPRSRRTMRSRRQSGCRPMASVKDVTSRSSAHGRCSTPSELTCKRRSGSSPWLTSSPSSAGHGYKEAE